MLPALLRLAAALGGAGADRDVGNRGRSGGRVRRHTRWIPSRSAPKRTTMRPQGDRTVLRSGAGAGFAESDRFDVLAALVAAHEREHWPIHPPDPVGYPLLQERQGYNPTGPCDPDRVAIPCASEILSRKRSLTLEMLCELHREWGIPAESLLRGYDLEISDSPYQWPGLLVVSGRWRGPADLANANKIIPGWGGCRPRSINRGLFFPSPAAVSAELPSESRCQPRPDGFRDEGWAKTETKGCIPLLRPSRRALRALLRMRYAY